MYQRTKKIPTIIGLLLLIIGIGGGIYLVENRTSTTSKAQNSYEPVNVLKTNITDNSFTVTWLTKEAVTGFIIYGTTNNNLNQIALDDRDYIDSKPKPYKTHHVSVKNLSPNTKYYFIINSGNHKFLDGINPYVITTAPKLETPIELEPAYGTVIDQYNQPAEGALVILTLPHALPLSTLVKNSGNWLIPLTTVRDNNLKPYQAQNNTVESIQIYYSLNEHEQASVTTDINNHSPVPTVTLGKTYNFQGLQGKKETEQNQSESTANKSQADLNLTANQKNKVSIINPEEGATFVTNKPLFRGQGIPGKEVLIEIEAKKKINGKTTVGKDGLWSWTPPIELSPDEHKLKITTVDENNKEIVLERNFLVFKSGTQVLGEATPSAQLTPTITITVGGITPSASLTPSFSPSLTPTPTTQIPVSGGIFPTLSLITIGSIFLVFGLIRIWFLKI